MQGESARNTEDCRYNYFLVVQYINQHCFICHPSEIIGIEPRTVATLAMANKNSNKKMCSKVLAENETFWLRRSYI